MNETNSECSKAFDRWWKDEGSGMPPRSGEDCETHSRRVCEIAWKNGAYIQQSKIESLQSDNQKLREALEEVVSEISCMTTVSSVNKHPTPCDKVYAIAKAALAETKQEEK